MRIKNLSAQDVFGYLPLDVTFNRDLTFLTGLNGSGKTTALRLLMALLTPVPEDIIDISFSTAEVTVTEGDKDLTIQARRNSSGLELSLGGVAEPLVLTSAEQQLLLNIRREERPREEARSPIIEKITEHPVYRALRQLATPMFLGLDRRFIVNAQLEDEGPEARRREFFRRRVLIGDQPFRWVGGAAGLADVNILVNERLQDIKAAQAALDENLRDKFLARSFEYKPSDITGSFRPPSRVELERYRNRLSHIEKAAAALKLPVPELRTVLSTFFDRMNKVVASLEEQGAPSKKKSKRASGGEKTPSKPPIADNAFVEWIMNKPQADRILEHLGLLDDYVQAREALDEPMKRLLSLVNGFLSQTKKAVEVNDKQMLAVRRDNDGQLHSLTSLSSGERQIIVMLGHLSLNPLLHGSGVFIVDEPELSLHISWQERFVDAIAEANPSAQLILATHSPAIILDRDAHCVSLS